MKIYKIPNQREKQKEKMSNMENQTKEKEKENQGDKTSTGEDRNKNTSKTNKLGTRHFKSYQENLVDKKIEPKLKEEEQTDSTTTKRK